MKHINRLHQHLSDNISWYKHWHEGALHKVVHYGILLFTVLFTVGLIISSSPTKAVANTYYIATTGSDSNPGTITAPWKNLAKLESVTLNPGDTVYIRGGTYNSTKGAGADSHLTLNGLNGTSASPITISAYPGEKPIFDLYSIGAPTASYPYGMQLLNSQYVHLKGLTIRNLRQVTNGSGISFGFFLTNSDNNTVEQFNIYNIGGTGFFINHSFNNLMLNNDSHHNGDGIDTGYGEWNSGDGFGLGTGGDDSSNNVYQGNRAWLNSDDGYDSFSWGGTKLTLTGNWSFWNGVKPWKNATVVPANETGMTPGGWSNVLLYNINPGIAWGGEGFKLGGHDPTLPNNGSPTSLRKFVQNNLAFENTGAGFPQNMEALYAHKMQLVNNIAWGNGNDGFGFGVGRSSNPSIAHIFMNNIAWNNNRGDTGGDFVFDGINGTSTTNGTSVPSISTNYWATWYQLNFGNLQSSFAIAASDFQSLDSTGADGPRQADGSLPNLPFLKPSATSRLIDKGTIINNLNGIIIPFNGTKPDLGAYESGTTPTTPTVSLTAPLNTTPVTTVNGSIVQVSANTTGTGITNVSFYLDGTTTLLPGCTPNPDTTPSYACIWNTTAVSNGTHTITAKVSDATTSATSSVVTVNVQNAIVDTQAPTSVSLTDPTGGMIITSTYPLKATAADNVGVTKVEFYEGTNLIGSATGISGANTVSQYGISWDTDSYTNNTGTGTWSLTVKAYDAVGHITTSAPVSVKHTWIYSDTIAPTNVVLTNPTVPKIVKTGNIMTLKATATDNVGIKNIEFYVNDVRKCTDSTSYYTCRWTVPAATSTISYYNIKAIAYDAAGNSTASSVVKLTVNAKTTGSFTFEPFVINQNSGGIFRPQIDITTTNPPITKVEFYLGTTLIGTDLSTQSPFDIAGGTGYNSTLIANGTYDLTAKATNSLGTQTSAPLSVTISN